MTDPIRIDERNYVEKPLLDQLAGLGWEIIDLDNKQHPPTVIARVSPGWCCCWWYASV